MALRAIAFDLYGTLLRIGRRAIHREVPRLLSAPHERWMDLVRGSLLTTAFPDDAALVRFVCDELAPDHTPQAEAACLEAVRREVLSVEALPGVQSLLSFLKRRGYKLGLLSNLSSAHVAPVARFGLAELFDATVFSCDEGITKPAPEIYARLLARLGVEAQATLFVGDSGPNDVEAPAALGMRTAGIKTDGRDLSLHVATELGHVVLEDPALPRLLHPGQEFEMGSRFCVEKIRALADDEQGRYNLVAAVDAKRLDGRRPETSRFYVKRFLLPETAYVEELAYSLQRAAGLHVCDAAVLEGREPLLFISEAPGQKLEGALTPDAAFEIGKHFGFGFLFSNADLRPRNAFRHVENGVTRVTIVDMEHCLFNLAIDTAGLAEPYRKETFDRMPEAERAARIKKRVLSRKTSSRARKAFLGDAPRASDIGRAYDAGFLEFYARQRLQTRALEDLIADRIRREPPLVIGTHSYRRAMAEIDLEDIRARLALPPEEALGWMW